MAACSVRHYSCTGSKDLASTAAWFTWCTLLASRPSAHMAPKHGRAMLWHVAQATITQPAPGSCANSTHAPPTRSILNRSSGVRHHSHTSPLTDSAYGQQHTSHWLLCCPGRCHNLMAIDACINKMHPHSPTLTYHTSLRCSLQSCVTMSSPALCQPAIVV